MKTRLILISILIVLLTACGGAATTTPAPIVPPSPIAPLAPSETPTPIGPLPTPVSPVIGLPQGTDGYPWWNDTVFYEIFVRSYADSGSESGGDGIGDLNGLISKLDYLKNLGITGMWLMPIQPSPSYHGYDVTDYYGVNPQYGTTDDFKRLMSEAHARGIRVIIDFVLNHTSDQHPWFEAARDPQSPFRDWYVWSKTDPGQAGWHVAASGFYYGYFTENMPDLNYRTPEVTEKMTDVARFWLQDMGVDGFRLDAAKYLIEDGTSVQNTDATHQWYKNFRPAYKALNPQALTIGEVWDLTSTASEYAQGDQLDLTFDFDLAKAFILAARTGRAAEAVNALNVSLANFKPLQFGTFLTNHDQNRVMSQIGANLDKAKVGALLYLTAPGVPFVYYGEEIAMSGKKPDEDIRTPMQWSNEANGGFTTGRPWRAVNADYTERNVSAQIDNPDSMLALYRNLIRLRNQHAALRVGDFTAINASHASVFASLRVSKAEAVLIIINLGKDPVKDLTLNLDKSPLAAGDYRAVPLFGDGPIANLSVTTQGGFAKYQPLSSLSGFSGVIVQLQR